MKIRASLADASSPGIRRSLEDIRGVDEPTTEALGSRYYWVSCAWTCICYLQTGPFLRGSAVTAPVRRIIRNDRLPP